MYKTTFLSHLARAGRQHPFFSQNVNSANSTALSLVKPKLGLATERAYFSSWGNNGYGTSNAGGTSSSQTVIGAITSDDNQPWERDLRIHRKQFRSIAGVRRYSTGTSTVVENSAQNGSIELIGTNLLEAQDGTSDGSEEKSNARQVKSERETANGVSDVESTLDNHLSQLLVQKEYIQLCEEFENHLKSDTTLSTRSFNLVFQAIASLEQHPDLTRPYEITSQFNDVSAVLQYYRIMLEKQILPDSKTYNTILDFLLRHRAEISEQKSLVSNLAFTRDTPQEVFLQHSDEKLTEAENQNAGKFALQIFKASHSMRKIIYSPEILDSLLEVCVQEANLEDAIDIFDQFDRYGIAKSWRNYAVLLEVCVKAKDLPGAIACFNSWKAECDKLESHDFFVLYDAMIRCYFASGDSAGGVRFWKAAEKTSRRIRPRHYENLARCYAQQGMYDDAIAFARETSSSSETDFSRVLGAIIQAAIMRGDVDICRTFFKEVKSLPSFSEASHAHWSYLACLASNGYLDEAFELVLDCARNKLELRIAHVSFLMTKLIAAGRLDRALQLAQMTGERRLIWSITELNKRKVAIFADIFVHDLLRNNLVDSKSIPRITSILYMIGRSIGQSATLDFMLTVQRQMAPEDLVANKTLLEELCMLSNALCNGQITEERRKETVDIVKWLLNIAGLAVREKSLTPSSDSLALLVTNARLLDIDEELKALETLLETPATDPGQLMHLLPSRLVFSDETANLVASTEISKALEIADPKNRPPTQTNPRLPYSRMVELFRNDRINGDVLLKAVAHFGRVYRPDHADELMSLVDEILPNMVASPDLLPAAKALVYDTAIIAYNNLQNNVAAQKYHDNILDLGFIPSANAYASFIAKMDENLHRDGATRAVLLFQEAMKLGVKPTEYLFNTVIAKLAKARRNDEALELFQKMKDIGLSPNVVTYGTIINSCCRVGKTAQAEELLLEMERLPRHQNRIAPYNTLIQHFVQTKKDRAKALFYWEKLIARTIPPTAHSYRLLIEARGHLTPADPVGAEAVIELMQRNRIQVETIHHAAIVHMYGVVLQDLAAAERYFENCVRSTSHLAARLDSILYQSIIEAHVQAKDVVGMESLLLDMESRTMPLNAYIVNLAIQGYGQALQIEKARELFDKLPSSGAGTRGKEPSTYECMIKAYISAGTPEKAREILDLLKSQQYPAAIVQRAELLLTSSAEQPQQQQASSDEH